MATFTINVLGFDPKADSYSAVSGTLTTVLPVGGLVANDSNPNGGALTAHMTTPTTHGTLVMDANNAGGFSYTSVDGYVGTDTFGYKLKNAAGVSSKYSRTVTINVAAAPPVVTAVKILTLNSAVPGGTGSVTAQITSSNAFKAGVTVNVGVNGAGAGSGVTDAKGQAVIAFTTPANPGNYPFLVSSGGFTATSSIEVTYSPLLTGLQITNAPGGLIGAKDVLKVKITSNNGVLSGAPIVASIDGTNVGTTLTQFDGTASVNLVLPLTPGNHTVKVVSGSFSDTQTLKVSLPAPVVSSITLGVPSGKPSQGVYLTAKITSANPYKGGAPVSVYIDGKKVATKMTDATGTAKIAVKLPALAGKHSIKVVSGSKSAAKTVTLGTAVTAKLAKLKTVKTKKTQTIKGSFGYKSGKITLKITDPKGKTVTKIVTLNSKGKFSYKYKTSKVKGTWTVRYSYRATPKYYGAKDYKLTFKVK